jgi:GDPmannose 4,6-dehydratase
MKAIIFGSTGQDGSHLSELLLEKGYEVVAVARRTSTGNLNRISHLTVSKNFSVESADITDSFSVMNVFRAHRDVTEVYNLAAQSHVAVSFKQPAITWDITGKGCLNIIQSMVDLKLNARFYQASSSEMFGKNFDSMEIPVDLVAPFDGPSSEIVKYQDENTKFMPQSPYAIAKCAAHHMTRLFREAYGLHASSGILFNHEGPRRGENFVTKKITLWVAEYVKWCEKHSVDPNKTASCNKEEELYCPRRLNRDQGLQFPKLRLGNLEAFRDWGYAGDYVEAMWMMLQQERPDDYVICTGETHTIRDFLDAAFLSAGIDSWHNAVVIDPEFYRPAEVDYLRGINDKAKNQLGWTPKHSFKELVHMMVQHDLK